MADHARGVAVVTGGSAGLGRAVVRQLARDGFDVAVLARGPDRVEQAAREVQAAGRRGLGVPVDVGDWEAVDRAASRVEVELGPVAVWVNDAMASVFAPFWEIEPAEFEHATRVTYLGVVNGTRAALARMRPRDRGHIVQVGSALAYRGIPLQSPYCGAKHAIVGFTESVRTELLHEHSRVAVSMVHMPALNTPQFSWVRSRLPEHPQPVPPIFDPEVGARTVGYVATHPKRSTWVGASTVGTIVGNRLAGALLDRYLARSGYQSQQTTRPGLHVYGDNFEAPVPGDPGAHGDFDDVSRARSVQAELAARRTPAVTAAATGGLAALTVAGARRAWNMLRS
jgi:NAD(P)-dependent dehydrogenase (short-subunit alcohol dehydrogenase family)